MARHWEYSSEQNSQVRNPHGSCIPVEETDNEKGQAMKIIRECDLCYKEKL